MDNQLGFINQGLWRDLPVEDILSLCRTNREFRKLCKDNNTWIFLLERDFNKRIDPREKYMKLYKTDIWDDFKQNFEKVLEDEHNTYVFNSKYNKTSNKIPISKLLDKMRQDRQLYKLNDHAKVELLKKLANFLEKYDLDQFYNF